MAIGVAVHGALGPEHVEAAISKRLENHSLPI